MKVGDTVRHKLSGDILTITKISEGIATCRRQEPIKSKWLGIEHEHWTAICHLKNLEPIHQ